MNTVDQKLSLDEGAVSKSNLKMAGNKTEKECKEKYPKGINIGEIAKTEAGKLSFCTNIYHAALKQLGETAEENKSALMVSIFTSHA